MNAEIFAEWFRRRGLRVVRTSSSYWVNLGKRVYQAFPYHWLIQPEAKELKGLFSYQAAVGLRYSTPLQAPGGCLSYHAVFDQPAYDLELLGKKARYDVRHGLQNCRITRITFPQLAEEGWPLLKDTLARQARPGAITYEAWRRLCTAAGELPGFEAWGALVGRNLAAAALTLQLEDCGYILYHQSLSRYHAEKVNNALCFELTRDLKMRPGAGLIHYGLHSLDAPASVDQFKFRMGYQPKTVRQRVVFHPCLQGLINPVSRALVQKLRHFYPQNPALAKAEGLMRFYLEGRRPLAAQRLPEVMAAPNFPRTIEARSDAAPGKN
jgi:hypothetical protein